MAYEVIFAPAAVVRLADIVTYIAADDPIAAEALALHLIDRAELVADFPELATAYRKRRKVRRLRCDPYFIYYRVKSKERVIEIMEFWHAARREPAFRIGNREVVAVTQ